MPEARCRHCESPLPPLLLVCPVCLRDVDAPVSEDLRSFYALARQVRAHVNRGDHRQAKATARDLAARSRLVGAPESHCAAADALASWFRTTNAAGWIALVVAGLLLTLLLGSSKRFGPILIPAFIILAVITLVRGAGKTVPRESWQKDARQHLAQILPPDTLEQ